MITKHIVSLLLITSFYSLSFCENFRVKSVEMSSAHKQLCSDKPKMVTVKFSLHNGSVYEQVAPIINTTKQGHFALIDIKQANSKLRFSLETTYAPESYYLVVSPETDASGNKIIRDVQASEGSATGTPGNLLWKNYLGTIYHEPTPEQLNRPGATRRTDFCRGKCAYKNPL